MKIYQIAGIACLSLILPLNAMAADDEVTIRVMQRNENTQQAVLHIVELPPVASENATDNGQQANREQEKHRLRKHTGEESEQEQEGSDAQEEMMNQSQLHREEKIQEMEQIRENMNATSRSQGPMFE